MPHKVKSHDVAMQAAIVASNDRQRAVQQCLLKTKPSVRIFVQSLNGEYYTVSLYFIPIHIHVLHTMVRKMSPQKRE